MDTYKLSWSYSLSADAVFRLPILEGGTSFRHITKQIVRGLSVLCCHRSEIEGTGFVRPVYTVFVGNELFDLIFNSTYGYRAAYFRSPGAGLDANDLFMRAIASRLEEDSLSPNSGLAQAFLHESLITPSAKVWLVEHGKEIDSRCFGCKGEWG